MENTIFSSFRRGMVLLCSGLGLSAVHAATFNVTTYGAVGNGTTNDRTAIQTAINTAAATASPTNQNIVLVGGNKTYLTGSLRLKSYVTLQIDAGSTIKGVVNDTMQYENTAEDIPDYRAFIGSRQLIYAARLTNVKITGGGTIDGDAQNDNSSNKVKDGRPYSLSRPHLLKFFMCTNVVVENVTLKNSNFWTQPYINCDSVIVSRVKVINPIVQPRWGNNDGIDILGCKKMWIMDCNIQTMDDAICVKPTALIEAKGTVYDREVNGLHVLRDTVRTGYGHGFKIGTETEHNVRNVTVDQLYVKETVRSAIAIEQVDGGKIENINITNTKIDSTSNPLIIRLGYRHRTLPPNGWLGTTGVTYATPGVGSINNVTINNLTCTKSKESVGSWIVGVNNGTAKYISNITLSNFDINMKGGETNTALVNKSDFDATPFLGAYPEDNTFKSVMPAYGLFARYVDGLNLSNINMKFLTTDVRPAFKFDQVKNLAIASTGTFVKAQKGAATAVAIWNSPDAGKSLVLADQGGGNWRISTNVAAVGKVVTNEAELMAYVGSDAITLESNATNYLKGAQVKLAANAIADYITFTIPPVAAGTYNLKAYYTKANNRAICQFSVDGVNKGAAVDMYASAPAYKVMVDLGTVTLTGTNATHKLKMAVTGRNASNTTGYTLNLDEIVLTPQ